MGDIMLGLAVGAALVPFVHGIIEVVKCGYRLRSEMVLILAILLMLFGIAGKLLL